jgi:hypothetical protein
LENNLETALNRLKSKKLIDKYIIKLIYGKDENNNFKYREATNEDLKLILKEERNAMLELDCKNMQQICAKGLWGEMQQIVLRYLKPYGIDSYYNCYKLIVNKEAVQDVIETEYNAWRLNKEQKEENLQTVNNAVIERIYHNMIKRKERTIKEYNKYFESELISATPLDKWEKIKLSAKHALQTNPKYEEYFCTLSSALITQSDMNKSFITNFIDFDE